MKMRSNYPHLKHKKRAHVFVVASFVPNLDIKLDVILYKKNKKFSFINYRKNKDIEKVSAPAV